MKSTFVKVELIYWNYLFSYSLYRSSHQGFLWKKMFLEISQNSQENTCGRVSFVIKLQALAITTFSKPRFISNKICLLSKYKMNCLKFRFAPWKASHNLFELRCFMDIKKLSTNQVQIAKKKIKNKKKKNYWPTFFLVVFELINLSITRNLTKPNGSLWRVFEQKSKKKRNGIEWTLPCFSCIFLFLCRMSSSTSYVIWFKNWMSYRNFTEDQHFPTNYPIAILQQGCRGQPWITCYILEVVRWEML